MKKSAKGKQRRRKKMKPSVRSEKGAEAEVPGRLGCGSWQAGPTSSKEPSSVRSPVTRNRDIQNRWKGGCSGWWRGALGGWSPSLSIPTTLTAAPEPPLRPPGSGSYHLETSTQLVCLLHTHSKPPGLEKHKVCLRLKEERNVYSGCSQDMLPRPDHSILTTQN